MDTSAGNLDRLSGTTHAAGLAADWEQLLELPDVLVPLTAPASDARGIPPLRRGLRALGAAARCPRAVVLLGALPEKDVLRDVPCGCAARLLERAPETVSRTFRLAWAALQEGHPVAWRAGGDEAAAPLPRALRLLAGELGVPLAVLGHGPSWGWELRLLDAAGRAGWGGEQAWLGSADEGRLGALASALRPQRSH